MVLPLPFGLSVERELENRLQRTLALSSVYEVPHRHGGRKAVPDTRHRQSDAVAQAAWRK